MRPSVQEGGQHGPGRSGGVHSARRHDAGSGRLCGGANAGSWGQERVFELSQVSAPDLHLGQRGSSAWAGRAEAFGIWGYCQSGHRGDVSRLYRRYSQDGRGRGVRCARTTVDGCHGASSLRRYSASVARPPSGGYFARRAEICGVQWLQRRARVCPDIGVGPGRCMKSRRCPISLKTRGIT